MVAALLLAQGGLLALGLILIDEVDNAYGDVPLRQNSCRPNRSKNLGAAMKDENGTVRTSIQRQSSSATATAREHRSGSGCPGSRYRSGDTAALAG